MSSQPGCVSGIPPQRTRPEARNQAGPAHLRLHLSNQYTRERRGQNVFAPRACAGCEGCRQFIFRGRRWSEGNPAEPTARCRKRIQPADERGLLPADRDFLGAETFEKVCEALRTVAIKLPYAAHIVADLLEVAGLVPEEVDFQRRRRAAGAGLEVVSTLVEDALGDAPRDLGIGVVTRTAVLA